MTFCCGVSPGGAGPAYLRIGLLVFRPAFANGPVAVNRVASTAERGMSCIGFKSESLTSVGR